MYAFSSFIEGKDTGTAAGAGAGAGAGGSLPAFSGQPSPSLPEVEKITGEEGERHVIQVREREEREREREREKGDKERERERAYSLMYIIIMSCPFSPSD